MAFNSIESICLFLFLSLWFYSHLGAGDRKNIIDFWCFMGCAQFYLSLLRSSSGIDLFIQLFCFNVNDILSRFSV